MKRFIPTFGGILVLGLVNLVGCTGDGQPTLLPNSDPSLQKSSTEFAADAAKRNYEADAPKGDNAEARAEYTLMTRHFDLANLSDHDWTNVEVWVNHKFVLFVPKMEKGADKTLNFELFYDSDGHHFATSDGKNPIDTLQIYRDGKMYDVTATLE